jgi:hypothetical protein
MNNVNFGIFGQSQNTTQNTTQSYFNELNGYSKPQLGSLNHC